MTAITYDGAVPTPGGDADTWGAELNVGALAKIKVDLDMLNTTTASTILGRNEGTTGEVERLTPAEVVAMLPQADLTARLLPGYARAAGALIAVTSTTATLTNGLNVSGVTWGAVDATYASVAVAFTVAMSSANYHVQATAAAPGTAVPAAPCVNSLTRTVNGFTLIYDKNVADSISLSVFAA